ncbi:MAG: MarR family winged helix-turn-helix transcriptional regulator [Sneathiella sp.]
MTQNEEKDRIASQSSHSTKTVEGRHVINIDTYAPFFLAAVNNALSRGASQLYIKKFGIGIVSWRVLSMLAIEPGVTAVRICDVIHLDKSATSRALKSLHEDGFLKFIASSSDPRSRRWWLNDRGYELHDKILELALQREKILLEDVDEKDHQAFMRVMKIMQGNLEKL